eukprot:m51a1_g1220 putative zinc finger protein (1376) ;mRNA; f:496800-503008
MEESCPLLTWLIDALTPSESGTHRSSANPKVLASFILSLLRGGGETAELREQCLASVADFIGGDAHAFVDELFEYLAAHPSSLSAPPDAPDGPGAPDAAQCPAPDAAPHTPAEFPTPGNDASHDATPSDASEEQQQGQQEAQQQQQQQQQQQEEEAASYETYVPPEEMGQAAAEARYGAEAGAQDEDDERASRHHSRSRRSRRRSRSRSATSSRSRSRSRSTSRSPQPSPTRGRDRDRDRCERDRDRDARQQRPQHPQQPQPQAQQPQPPLQLQQLQQLQQQQHYQRNNRQQRQQGERGRYGMMPPQAWAPQGPQYVPPATRGAPLLMPRVMPLPCKEYETVGYCSQGSLCPYRHDRSFTVPMVALQVPPPVAQQGGGPELLRPPVAPAASQPWFAPQMLQQQRVMALPVPQLPLRPPVMPIAPLQVPQPPAPIKPVDDGKLRLAQQAQQIQPVGPLPTREHAGRTSNAYAPYAPPIRPAAEQQQQQQQPQQQQHQPPLPLQQQMPHGNGAQRRTEWDNSLCTLLVTQLPPAQCTIGDLNRHFSKFGDVTNIQVRANARKAFVQFATHAEALAAKRSPEAVFGNRFVRVVWANPNHSDQISEFEADADPQKPAFHRQHSPTANTSQPGPQLPLQQPQPQPQHKFASAIQKEQASISAQASAHHKQAEAAAAAAAAEDQAVAAMVKEQSDIAKSIVEKNKTVREVLAFLESPKGAALPESERKELSQRADNVRASAEALMEKRKGLLEAIKKSRQKNSPPAVPHVQHPQQQQQPEAQQLKTAHIVVESPPAELSDEKTMRSHFGELEGVQRLAVFGTVGAPGSSIVVQFSSLGLAEKALEKVATLGQQKLVAKVVEGEAPTQQPKQQQQQQQQEACATEAAQAQAQVQAQGETAVENNEEQLLLPSNMTQAIRTLLVALPLLVAAQHTCPYPLTPTVPEHFIEPPVLIQALSGPLGDVVDINLTLPQTVPERWNATAEFENPATHALTDLELAFNELPCKFESITQLGLPELIRNAQPYIVETETQYVMRFLIRVSWSESFTLAGTEYERLYDASVGFEIILYRQLQVSSAITTLDATLVWGYIQKMSVFVPLDRSQPTVEFDLITVAAEDDYAIDPSTILTKSTAGHIQAISSLTYVGNVDGSYNKQRWHLRAVIDQYSICSTSINDQFTLEFVLSSSRDLSASHTTGLTGTLEGLENWCMLNTTVRLNGVQTTHTSADAAQETVRFFIGDMVHVRDRVFTDLVLVNTSALSVVLSGAALRAAGPVTIYAGAPGTEAYGFALESCPAGSGPAFVCYRFELSEANFIADRSLTITSTISATIDQHGRRSAGRTTQSARVANTVTFGSRAQQPTGGSSAVAPLLAVSALLVPATQLL